ncbi:FCP1 homology domain-containing protein [Pararobbsia alpina]
MNSTGIVTSSPGVIKLFEFAPVLEDVLRPFPAIEVVFSSDWAFRFGAAQTRRMLPSESLQNRVTGATFEGCEFNEQFWPMLKRGEQVLDYVRRHSLVEWLAIDDRKDGFESCMDRLVLCQAEVGLGDDAVVTRLRNKLSEMSR